MATYRIALRLIPVGSSDKRLVANIDETWCKSKLAEINAIFEPANIEFVFGSLDAPVYDDALQFDIPGRDAAGIEVKRKEYAEKFPHELVVFVRVFHGDCPCCKFAYAALHYSSLEADYVVAEPGSETWSLAHEFGHFMGLPHTFDDGIKDELAALIKDVPARVNLLSNKIAEAIGKGVNESEALNVLDGDRELFTDTPPDASPYPFQRNDDANEADSSSGQVSIPIKVEIKTAFLSQTMTYELRPDKLNVMSYFKFSERPHLSPQQAKFVHELVYSGKRRRLIQGRWTNWIPCGDAVLKESPSVIRRQPGLLELFGRGLDDHTWQNTFINGAWTGWFPHEDNFTLGSSPNVGSMNPGHLLLVACDTTGRVHAKYWLDSSGKWTNWEPLGNATLKGSPSIICRNPNLVELFGLAMDGFTWQNTFTNGAWSGWFSQEDNFALSTTPTAGSMNAGHLLLVACESQGAVVAKYWLDGSGKWTNWEPLGAATFKNSPSIICRNPQLVELFAHGMDDRTWQNTFINGKWLEWFSHNDNFEIGATPTVGSMSADHLQLFVTSPDGAVWQKWWVD